MDELVSRAAALQVWAYPLVFAQRMRLNLTQPWDPEGPRPTTSAGAPAGVVGHQRSLADPGLAVGVAPNVDTLYSLAWLDLDDGVHEVSLPDPGERYFSLQVGCADTSSPLVVSRRTHDRTLPSIRLRRGPRSVSEEGGVLRLSTPERWVMVVGRTGVDPDDAADVAAAHALQDAISLVGGGPRAARAVDRLVARAARPDEILDPATFAISLAAVLDDLGPAQVPDELARSIEELGIDRLAAGAADDATTRAVAAGLRAGYDAVRARVQDLGRTVNGWSVNDRGPDFAGDLLLRAAVAHAQIYVNPAAEALYPVCETDVHGNALEGRTGPYVLEFAPDALPPARAFWSLTMYHREGLLVENRIRRYAIGDRTPGLTRETDGALRIHLSVTEPEAGPGNWLPAPDGRFRLMLRLYWPQDAPRWEPPAVVKVTA